MFVNSLMLEKVFKNTCLNLKDRLRRQERMNGIWNKISCI